MKKIAARSAYLLLSGVSAFCFGLIFTGLTAYYVRTVGMDPLQLVLVGTAIELTCFLFEVPTGVVADTYSRRLSLLIGGFLVGACYILTGLVPIFVAIISAEIIRGVGETFKSGATDAWITDEVGADKVGELFARSGQVSQVCSLVGVLLSILLASLYNYQTAILLGATLYILLHAYLCFAMPETGFVRPARAVGAARRDALRESIGSMLGTLRTGLGVVRATPVLLLLILAEAIRGAASEGYDRLAEAHILTSFNLPVLSLPAVGQLDPIAWFGVFEIVGTVLGVTVMEVVRRRFTVTNQTSNATVARWLMFFYGMTTVCVVAFALADNFWLAAIAFLLKGVFYGPPGPISGTWMNLHIPSNVRATVLSMDSQANAFGQFGGGPGVGWVGKTFGIRAAIAIAGLLHTPMLWLYARFVRRAEVQTARPLEFRDRFNG
jgi:MFS family permease